VSEVHSSSLRDDRFWHPVRIAVHVMNAGACLLLTAVMAVTCADVLLRVLLRRPIPGALDLVEFGGGLIIALALPYTTAVKGHVAVEFFFHKLRPRARIVVDTLERLCGITLFGALAWGCYRSGLALKHAGQVTMTLRLPLYLLPWALGGSCCVVAIVVLYNLLHPGREMIKP